MEAQAGKFTPVMVAIAGLSSAMLILQPERPFSVWFRTSPSVVFSPTEAISPGSMLTVLVAVTGITSRMRKMILYNSHEYFMMPPPFYSTSLDGRGIKMYGLIFRFCSTFGPIPTEKNTLIPGRWYQVIR